MHYIEAPSKDDAGRPSVFLAGGITDCPDWQAEICILLGDTSLTVLNPRRANFPIHDPDAAAEQIRWEHGWLQDADAVLFWFSRGSLNPIVLFEYGMRLGWQRGRKDLPTFVGCDPEYPRLQDVFIQTKLEGAMGRLSVPFIIHDNLHDLANEVRAWSRNFAA